MKTILALDLGTKLGWAIRRSHQDIFYGVVDLSPSKCLPRAYRFAIFQQWLDRFFVDVIVYKDVKRHKGTYAAHMWGALEGILLAHCVNKKIAAHALGVGEVKRHATGKGNAGKDAVIAAMVARGFKPQDDNDADALALLFAYLDKEESA